MLKAAHKTTMCDTIKNNYVKRCFKIRSELLQSLHVNYNLQQNKIVFWNKYQIFVFDDFTADLESLSFIPEFIIHQVALTNNYLVCLDCNGNVNTVSLKFKANAQKRFKASFNPRENNTICLLNCDIDYIYSIKIEFDTFFLCANKLNTDFQSLKKVLLNFNDDSISTNDLMQKCIVKVQLILEAQYSNLAQIFKIIIDKESHLLVISPDSISVYCAVANFKKLNDEINLTKLYKSCSKICDIQISALDALEVIIGLESGSFVILAISMDLQAIKTIHMNTSISKFVVYKDNIFYSDGLTFWKADKILSVAEFNVKQMAIKLVKDFTVIKDQMIATVYSNNIYVLSLEDSNFLIDQDCKEPDKYYSVNTLTSNSEYIHKIIALVNKNKEVLNKIQLESSYLLALGIAKNKQLRESLIQYKLLVYDNFQDILKQKDVLLTRNLDEYLSSNALLFLITVLSPQSFKVIELLNKLKDKIKLHVMISTDERNLDTTTTTVQDFSNQTNFLIPLKNENYMKLKIRIKLVVNVKGGLNGNLVLPTIISEKEFILNSEYFIRNIASNKSFLELQSKKLNIDELILQFSTKLYRNVFEFSEIKELTKPQYNYYLKLPLEFTSKLKKRDYYIHLEKEQCDKILRNILTDEFLNCKHEAVWLIGGKKIQLKIITEGIHPTTLKISGGDIETAWNIRKFFSKIFYGTTDDCQEIKMFISQAHYTVVENIQRKLRKCLEGDSLNRDTILEISDDIQANVLGLLPL